MMERDHKSRRRKEREKADGQERHHEHRRRYRHTYDQEGSGSRRKHNRHRVIPGEHNIEALPERALSGEIDYVQKWLAQTKNEVYPQDREYRQSQKELEHLANLQKSQQDIQSFHQHEQKTVDITHVRSEVKRNRGASLDSSLLETVARPKSSGSVTEYRMRDRTEKREGITGYPQKRRKVELWEDVEFSDGSSPYEMQQRQTFEKRRRHKTHEDRYEPKRRGGRPEKDAMAMVKTSRPNREKRGDRKKAANEGGDLMRNFASKNIGQDRLTIRPSSGLGIFKNGRVSSPNRRRGLPDLAFSEMEFLQRSRSNQTLEEDNIIPKSRVKEQQRKSREREEISAFFKPTRTPLRERRGNSRNRKPVESADDFHSLHSKPISTDEYRSSRRDSIDPSADLQETRLQRVVEPRSDLDMLSIRREQPPNLKYPNKYLDTISRRSEQATTYVTWSETEVSPGPRKLDQLDSRKSSPTPDFVRTCIKNTRIFKDTGVSPNSGLYHYRANSRNINQRQHPSVVAHVPTHNLSTYRHANATTSAGKFSSETPQYPRHGRSRDGPGSSGMLSCDPSIPNRKLLRSSIVNRALPETRDAQHLIIPELGERVTIELQDREAGWIPRKGNELHDIPTVSRNKDKTREVKSTPISREDIAKRVRIIRPSTVLPVAQVIKESQPSNRRNSLAEAYQTIQSIPEYTINVEPSSHDAAEVSPALAPLEPKALPTSGPNKKFEGKEKSQTWKPVTADQNASYPPSKMAKGNPLSSLGTEQADVVTLSRRSDAKMDRVMSSLGNSTHPAQANVASAYGLPLRGAMRSHGVGLHVQNPRSRPSLEDNIELLYTNQLQPQYVQHQVKDNYAANLIMGPSKGGYDTLSQRNSSDDDKTDRQILEEIQYVNSPGQRELYPEAHCGDNVRGSEYFDEETSDAFDLWQSEQLLNTQEMENGETWTHYEQDLCEQDATFDGYSGLEFVEPYETRGTSHGYYGKGGGDEAPMQGFWQPHRQY